MKMTEEQLKALLDNYIDDSQSAYQEVDGDIKRLQIIILVNLSGTKLRVSLV